MLTETLPSHEKVGDSILPKKDFSEFEHFVSSKKRTAASKSGDHIVQRVTIDWKLDMRVAQEVSRLIKLVVRDYIQFWFCSVSKRTDFVVDVEEIITNAICTVLRRAKDFINPYMFVGDKVCDVLVKTLTLFREACQKVKKEHGSVRKDSRQFQLLVANEFRNKGHLHVALMASGAGSSADKDAAGETGGDNSSGGSGRFKQNMMHSAHNTTSDLTMEEFFDEERLSNIESEYSFFVGGYVTKYLLDPKEENSKAGKHLFTEILSNIILGSVYWLCSPSSVYYYLHMAVAGYKPPVEAVSPVGSGSASQTPLLSEVDWHIGLREYFVGAIGRENVSSSCCSMSIEAAAAIVLREGESDAGRVRPEHSGQLPAVGSFIVRQYTPPSAETTETSTSMPSCPPLGLSLLPAVLCLSYIRPEKDPSSDSDCNSSGYTHWHVKPSAVGALSPTFDALGLQGTDFLKSLSGRGKKKCPSSSSESGQRDQETEQSASLSYLDSRIGHVVFLSYLTEDDAGVCYELLSCSHQSDVQAAMRESVNVSMNTRDGGGVRSMTPVVAFSLDALPRWSSLQEMLRALRGLVPSGLQFVDIPSVTPFDISSEQSQRAGDEEEGHERTLLLVEKNILLQHELEGAVEEYMRKKVGEEERILQVSSDDVGGQQAVRRLMEGVQNICMHGWLKKRFVAQHPRRGGSDGAIATREEGGRRIATCLSKMYAAILLQSTAAISASDNIYEEFLNKSPVLWLWLGHILAHCKKKSAGDTEQRTYSADQSASVLADNSLTEKMNIAQHCRCMNCNDANCYVQSMDIFLDHHGSFFVNKELTLDSYVECVLFCGLQTGKVMDVLEITALVVSCEGDYAGVESIAQQGSDVGQGQGGYVYSPTNVGLVQRLALHDFHVVPADQFAPEALLRSPSDVSQALALLMPLRHHYLHYFPGPADAAGCTDGAGSRGAVQSGIEPPPTFPQSPSKSKEKRQKPIGHVFKSMSMKTISAATSLMDDISSLAATTTRVLETAEAQKPRHLSFSTNMDIIQVSNIKFEAAQDKWRQKVGEGALFGSELQRRAEVAFVLRILLSHRPPMEFLESRNIIKKRKSKKPIRHACYYNIEILKYEKQAAPPPSLTQQVVVYYIDVYRRRPHLPCPVHVDPNSVQEDRDANIDIAAASPASGGSRARIYSHKCTCKKWTIRRRYTDFDELNKHLKSQINPALFNKFRLPQKAYMQVVQSSFFYARRLMGLREYLRSLLIGLPEMAEMDIFLAPDDDTDLLATVDPPRHPITTPHVASSKASDMKEDRNCEDTTIEDAWDPLQDKGRELESTSQGSSSLPLSSLEGDSAGGLKSSENVVISSLPEGSSEGRDRDRDKEKGRGSDKEKDREKAVPIDPRLISLLENRVHALVDEVLEEGSEGGVGMVKKNIVSLLCKSIGIFFNGAFIKWMKHQAREETSVTQSTALLALVRELFWPGDVLIVLGQQQDDEEVARETDRRLRAECIAKLNTMLPIILQGHQIVERLCLLFDNPFLLKSLAYTVIDLLLIDLFPELADKLSGMDSLQR